jgi:hypothetical protein
MKGEISQIHQIALHLGLLAYAVRAHKLRWSHVSHSCGGILRAIRGR